jgi:hypothetical protein
MGDTINSPLDKVVKHVTLLIGWSCEYLVVNESSRFVERSVPEWCGGVMERIFDTLA